MKYQDHFRKIAKLALVSLICAGCRNPRLDVSIAKACNSPWSYYVIKPERLSPLLLTGFENVNITDIRYGDFCIVIRNISKIKQACPSFYSAKWKLTFISDSVAKSFPILAAPDTISPTYNPSDNSDLFPPIVMAPGEILAQISTDHLYRIFLKTNNVEKINIFVSVDLNGEVISSQVVRLAEVIDTRVLSWLQN